jgi:hypothetical protein
MNEQLVNFEITYFTFTIVLYDERERTYLLFLLIFRREFNRMAKVEMKTKQKPEIEDSSSLKGTLASVFFLGIFIVVTWISVYYLFVERF